MSPVATLTGQDVGEAEGALTGLLERILAGSNTGLKRTEYITLRVLATRGPGASLADFREFLLRQPQLALDPTSVDELLNGLEVRGVITVGGPEAEGSVRLTAAGAALQANAATAVQAVTARLYAGLDPEQLSIAHDVLVELTRRASRLHAEG
jgi:DNA-binding MarR family transcriptional regulator